MNTTAMTEETNRDEPGLGRTSRAHRAGTSLPIIKPRRQTNGNNQYIRRNKL